METLNRRTRKPIEPIISGPIPEVVIKEVPDKKESIPIKNEAEVKVVIDKAKAQEPPPIIVYIPSQHVEYKEKVKNGYRTRWMHGSVNSIPFEIECDVQFNLANASPRLTAREVLGAISGILDYIRSRG